MLSGTQRRERILEILQRGTEPVTGQRMAEMLGVSRQIIVQDIAILRAGGQPVISTPRGYFYWVTSQGEATAVLPVCHSPDMVASELLTLVDHGVTVVNVRVEHAFYGELVGSLNLKSREDVHQFLSAIHDRSAMLLSTLTDGVHLHTVEGRPDDIAAAKRALSRMGILLGE